MITKIIAEIGSVHDGSLGNAIHLGCEAIKAGASIAKYQIHIAEKETTQNAPSPKYFSSESRYDYFNRTSFGINEWKNIKKNIEKVGGTFAVSVFSVEALKIALNLNCKIIKIPSGEVSNSILLNEIGKHKVKSILSTGMSTFKEIDNAVKNLTIKRDDIISIMQCSSRYPCKPEEVGLNVILELKKKYGNRIGFSDHTEGSSAAVIASYLGVNYIEKHITFSKSMYGSDAYLAMELDQFKDFCKSVKEGNLLRKNLNKNLIDNYLSSMKKTFQKGLYFSKPLSKGHIIKRQDISILKPFNNLGPDDLKNVIGKKLKQNIKKHQPINKNLIN